MISLLAAAAFLFQPLAVERRYEAEAQDLAADPKVAAAMTALDGMGEASLEDLVAITETPAPPFGEGPRAKLVAGMLEETGFGTVTTDEAGNVVARRKGTGGGEPVAVLAHIDTVFPEGTDVTVKRDGDTYAAPGIGDNARGVVLLLELARAIEEAGIETQRDILLVGNVGEEGLGDLSGVRHLFREGAEPLGALIAIDGSEAQRIVTSAVGSNRYRVRIEGPGGHSWSDFGAPNPHIALARAIAAFDEAARPITARGPKSSYSVGRIGGGTSVNSIPFESVMEVDMRSGDPEKLAALDEAFQKAMRAGLEAENKVRRVGEPLTLAVEPIGKRPAGQGDLRSPLVQHAGAALRAFGLQPETAASSTDANVPLSLGVPAITLSRGGRSVRAHSLDERWTDEETQRATKIALLTLLAEAGYAP
ncbi:M20/M25/M40 family metallo-hydrolase [Parvularcula dongshanensis]|uniref:Acetylornithine deacetylase/succinyl-diaminopimelate desuccinylase-like protein n=1 Tax=Parvularcula dongshanensis TaxID=1173995 RepID=A0A840I0I0_9PROT|nr:M20/M25/M40 family metallo-hydrolase [Parvularcula dongshanensis]MBB4657791.1 acetylornithine deacetylase/succinyl-diaminopimelate desuccinylase-like protein [Parvularcula dongshanensis]